MLCRTICINFDTVDISEQSPWRTLICFFLTLSVYSISFKVIDMNSGMQYKYSFFIISLLAEQ